jgi:hypothetical protein
VTAALASIGFLVFMLLVILLGAGEIPNGLFLVALLATAGLSIASALVALGVATTGRQRDEGARLSTVLVALAVLTAFVLAAVAIVEGLGNALN